MSGDYVRLSGNLASIEHQQLVRGRESEFASLFLGIPEGNLQRYDALGKGSCVNGQKVLHVFDRGSDKEVLLCPGRVDIAKCPNSNRLTRTGGYTLCPSTDALFRSMAS